MRRVMLSRRRAFSQQALRRWEEVSSGRRASTGANPTTTSLELDGRSYLLPTLTLSRAACASASTPSSSIAEPKDSQFFQTRANRATAVVLDLQQVSSDGSPHSQSIKKHELRNQVLRLQEAGYFPVGVTNASEDVKQLAAKLNLPSFISTRLHLEQQREVSAVREQDTSSASTTSMSASTTSANDAEDAEIKPETATLPPLVISRSVRSGQQIFAQNRSLVVLGNVNSGAEVLADEDVVVLGALKGRALAGIAGNTQARILCQSFDAELISIAHCFTTCDDLAEEQDTALRLHEPTTISLQDDRLHFESASS